MNNILSITYKNNRIIISFLGIQISSQKLGKIVKYFQRKQIWLEQDKYDLTPLKKAKDIIAFFIPENVKINGGILSIFNLCTYTRKVYPNACVMLVTYPNSDTYAHNTYFENDENIYRWEQLMDNAPAMQKLILHIPEYMAGKFYGILTKKDISFLKSVQDLQINILNQNMDLMPNKESWQNLYQLTSNITQTLAFIRNCTQEVADRYQIPTHLFSTYLDFSKYQTVAFEDKEKTIVLSPDNNDKKEMVVNALKKQLPDYKLVVVNNLTFQEYMNLIAKSFCTITFGEGFDGYFIQPAYVGSLSFAVYNETFFPNEQWANLSNVFASFEDMAQKLPNFLRKLEKDKNAYINLSHLNKEKMNTVYGADKYIDNLNRFYQQKYDILPRGNK